MEFDIHGARRGTISKKELFRQVFCYFDAAIPLGKLGTLTPDSKDKIGQIRKVVSEYISNLVERDPTCRVCYFELYEKQQVRQTEVIMVLSLFHDGKQYEQQTMVATIASGLVVLKASPYVALTTSTATSLNGFKTDIKLK